MAKAAGDDVLRREAQGNINLLASKYNSLCQASGLPTRAERMNVSGFKAVKNKGIDNIGKSGIIKEDNLVKLYDKNGTYLRSIPRPDVKLPDKTMSIITRGTHIMDVEVFAGKGSKNTLRVREHLKNNYGGNADDWQHTKGHAYVDTPNGPKKANVHWFEEETVGVVEMFVKGWSKK